METGQSNRSTIWLIFNNAFKIWKKNWMTLTLLALALRLVTVILSKLLGQTELSLNLTNEINNYFTNEENMSKIGALLEGSEWFDMSAFTQLYADIRAATKQFIMPLIWIGFITRMLTEFVNVITIKIWLEEYTDAKTDRTNKLSETAKQIIPYLLTLVLYFILSAIGLALFIIPGIILMGYFGLVQYVMVEKKKYFFSAFMESYEIIKGRRWKTLFIMIWIIFIILIAFLIIWFIFWFVVAFIEPSMSWISIEMELAIMWIIQSLVTVFVLVIFVAFYKRRDETRLSSTDESSAAIATDNMLEDQESEEE